MSEIDPVKRSADRSKSKLKNNRYFTVVQDLAIRTKVPDTEANKIQKPN
jgi:hypothetical protein